MGDLDESLLEHQRKLFWEVYGSRIAEGIDSIKESVRKFPAFRTLRIEDQITLMRYGFFEIWVIGISHFVEGDEIKFQDGKSLSRELIERAYDTDFASTLFSVAADINSYNLNTNQKINLMQMAFFHPVRRGLKDVKKVLYAAAEASINLGPERWQIIFRVMTRLRTLSERHWDFLDYQRRNVKSPHVRSFFEQIYENTGYNLNFVQLRTNE